MTTYVGIHRNARLISIYSLSLGQQIDHNIADLSILFDVV